MMGGKVGWQLLCKRMPARQVNKKPIPALWLVVIIKKYNKHRQQGGTKMLIVVTVSYDNIIIEKLSCHQRVTVVQVLLLLL
jgi:hypothetical protein